MQPSPRVPSSHETMQKSQVYTISLHLFPQHKPWAHVQMLLSQWREACTSTPPAAHSRKASHFTSGEEAESPVAWGMSPRPCKDFHGDSVPRAGDPIPKLGPPEGSPALCSPDHPSASGSMILVNLQSFPGKACFPAPSAESSQGRVN